jgi:hypothetical protein
MMSNTEQTKPAVSPKPVSDQPETGSTAVEAPLSALPTTNPLAKLLTTMLPNANPFIPSSNVTTNRPVSPIPTASMNNDAPPFIPSQHQHGSSQQHLSNTNAGHWGGIGARGGGGGNRRGQSGVRSLLEKNKIDTIKYFF